MGFKHLETLPKIKKHSFQFFGELKIKKRKMQRARNEQEIKVRIVNYRIISLLRQYTVHKSSGLDL